MKSATAGAWMTLFIYSKLPELLDTVWLVLKKRKVAYIHWFHHATVLLYCWHSFATSVGPGIWFGTMNYVVHSVMYFYYFLTTFPGAPRKVAKTLAPAVTVLQIMQMVVGVGITAVSAFWYYESGGNEEACHVNPANFKASSRQSRER